jgi:hypothetical protein
MVENVQQIEAMLAAYIDGELTPDERAELERHLEANPSHRALILELTGHRDLLRSLPREPAPEDLSEPLEGAIERDALLGGGDPFTEFKTMRTRRWWPQLLAAAAIFVLAFGLGAIVFYVLPPKHPTVAIVQPPEVETEGDARDEPEQRVARGTADSIEERDAEPVAAASAWSDATTSALAERSSPGGGGIVAVAGLDETATTTPTPDGTLVITITANDVQQASGELMAYFANNGIAWSEPANTEAVVALARVVKSEPADVGSVRLAVRSTPPPPAPAGVSDRNEPTLEIAAAAAEEPEGVARRDVAASGASPAPYQERAVRERRGVGVARSAAAPAPTTSPARPTAAPTSPPTPGLAVTTAGTAAGTAGTDHYVVLAALSSTQAERLADTFARPTIGRRAEVRREAVAIPAASQVAAPVAPRPTRRVQVGFATQGKPDETLRPDGEEFKLVRPATQPTLDPTSLWALQDDAHRAPTTQPLEPFAFRLGNLGRELEGPVFNCVVVLRKPEEDGAATQPAVPMTRPVSPAATTRPAVGPE